MSQPPSNVSTLRPRGALWSALGPLWASIEGAIDAAIDRIHARADQLIDEVFPETVNELLAEQEASAGLPNACTPSGQTVAQRRAALIEITRSRGGARPQYFIDVAEALGYDGVTIDERVGGDAGLWRMNIPIDTQIRPRRSGDPHGERYTDFGGDALLECVITNRRPAHTRVLFAYGAS